MKKEIHRDAAEDAVSEIAVSRDNSERTVMMLSVICVQLGSILDRMDAKQDKESEA